MAKKTSKKTSKKAKKTKKAEKKSVPKKLAKNKSTKKTSAKKPTRKQSKKPAKKIAKKAGKAAKSKAAAKGGVKRPRTKSAARPTASAKTASMPQPAETAVQNIVTVEAAAETRKRAKKITEPFPVEAADAERRNPLADPQPAAESAPSRHLFANVLARVHAACGALATEGGWLAGIDLSRVVV